METMIVGWVLELGTVLRQARGGAGSWASGIRSFLGQGATGAIVVIEADVDGRHLRIKRMADTDDSKVCEVHLA
jgi:hypothetical protein